MRLIPLIAAALLMTVPLVSACGPQGVEDAAAPVDVAAADEPVMPADAPPQEDVPQDAGGAAPAPAGPASGTPDPAAPATMPAIPIGTGCAAEIGDAAAAVLVKRCIAVSPATRPPCNLANACALIQGEIDRSCAQYGPNETRPPQCTG
ncbi:hypothetical protein [Brevundimonas sp.]|uniref:hypothetical protein n=1 Tax=Brevundimonas sp. TaxID=1871086 RepID=UPI002ABC3D26|nr:hypothetical protein [Brevundimonas sp.]MDZ4362606.1 hypothetical protein [Brevundimonas sp.]